MKKIFNIDVTDEHFDYCFTKQGEGGKIQEIEGKVYCLFEYEKLVNEEIINIQESEEYKAIIQKRNNQFRSQEIKNTLEELDKKRVRAMCEPELYDVEEGITWLEHYNTEIEVLRAELKELEI